MRKIVIIWISLVVAAPVAWAQSCCQTQTDSTTLTTETDCPVTQDAKVPQVVVYKIITQQVSPDAAGSKNKPLKQSYYKKDKVSVAHFYVPTELFPAWENDIPSEQEIWAQQQEELRRQEQQAQEENSTQPAAINEPTHLQGVSVLSAGEDAKLQLAKQEEQYQLELSQTTVPHIHSVVVSSSQTTSSTASSTVRPISSVRTVSSTTISNVSAPTSGVYGKTVEKTSPRVPPTVNEALNESDELFKESAAKTIGLAESSQQQAQTAAEQEIQRANAKVDNAISKTEKQVNQTLEQAQNQVNRSLQQADTLLSDTKKTTQEAYDRAGQAAANTQQAAQQTLKDVDDELFNDWDY